MSLQCPWGWSQEPILRALLLNGRELQEVWYLFLPALFSSKQVSFLQLSAFRFLLAKRRRLIGQQRDRSDMSTWSLSNLPGSGRGWSMGPSRKELASRLTHLGIRVSSRSRNTVFCWNRGRTPPGRFGRWRFLRLVCQIDWKLYRMQELSHLHWLEARMFQAGTPRESRPQHVTWSRLSICETRWLCHWVPCSLWHAVT